MFEDGWQKCRPFLLFYGVVALENEVGNCERDKLVKEKILHFE